MVEVAAIVTTERTSGVVVPTARLSERVVSRTTVPSSVQPAPDPVDAHERFPLPSVWRKLPAETDEGQV